MNYAGLGFIVGHEMTHGFDNCGRYFDKHGSYINLWDQQTSINYFRKIFQILVQYKNYTVEEVQMNVRVFFKYQILRYFY